MENMAFLSLLLLSNSSVVRWRNCNSTASASGCAANVLADTETQQNKTIATMQWQTVNSCGMCSSCGAFIDNADCPGAR